MHQKKPLDERLFFCVERKNAVASYVSRLVGVRQFLAGLHAFHGYHVVPPPYRSFHRLAYQRVARSFRTVQRIDLDRQEIGRTVLFSHRHGGGRNVTK